MFGVDAFWKYAAVFGALVAAGFGAPIPEEIPIATGGVLVGRDWNNPDGLKWWIMLPVCIVGVVLCDTILYLAGRQWGPWLIRRNWVQRRFLSPERFQQIEKNFHDYGIRILLIARLLPGIRTPVFLSAGIVKLPFRRFILPDALYAIPGVNLIFWLAYWLTDAFMALLYQVESYRELAIVAILSFVAGFITATFVRRPIATGSPSDLPVLGKPVVSIANPTAPEPAPGQPTIDGRPHAPRTPVHAIDSRPLGTSSNGPPAPSSEKPAVGKSPEQDGGV